jgi:hypothetical protein
MEKLFKIVLTAVLVTVGSAWAQTKAEAKAEKKAQKEQVKAEKEQAKAEKLRIEQHFKEATARKDSTMFTKPPLAGEIVLSTYQEKIESKRTMDISQEEANAWQSTRTTPKGFEEESQKQFTPRKIATHFFRKAVNQFPDIDIEDLDIRSLETVGNLHWTALLNPAGPSPFTGKWSLMVNDEGIFRCVIVKRASNIDQSPTETNIEQDQSPEE